jgi:hypothetical protein
VKKQVGGRLAMHALAGGVMSINPLASKDCGAGLSVVVLHGKSVCVLSVLLLLSRRVQVEKEDVRFWEREIGAVDIFYRVGLETPSS